MTDEELDRARAKHAYDITQVSDNPHTWVERTNECAARLAREGWTPLSPYLLKAREIVASVNESLDLPLWAEQVRQGKKDDHAEVIIALRALRESSK